MNHKRHKPRRQPCHKISSWDRVTGNAAGRRSKGDTARRLSADDAIRSTVAPLRAPAPWYMRPGLYDGVGYRDDLEPIDAREDWHDQMAAVYAMDDD